VKWLTDRLRNVWEKNPKLHKIVRDSSYLFSANMVNMVLGVVQSSLSARLLGVEGFGLLGIITAYASTINNLFSFRMGELVVKYLGDYLEEGATAKAGALVKAAALIEACSAVIAFVFLWLAAPLAAQIFAKDSSLAPLFVFYGIIVLAEMFYETSYGVVQVLGRFKGHAIINSAQSMLTAGLIVATFVMGGSLEMIIFAYFAGKVILGIAPVFLAVDGLNKRLGWVWWKASLKDMPQWRELLRFGLGSNFSATVNMIVRDSELLWVSFFLSPVEAGYYKVAIALNRYILFPINPFIQTTYPEINRYIKNKAWKPLRQFLRKVTALSATWTMLCAIGLVFLGEWVIKIYAGVEFLPAYPAMLILLIGYGMANTFFWNRSLLLSFGDSLYAFVTMLVAGLLKVLGGFVLVPRYGYLAEAGLFASFFVISVGLNLLRGHTNLRRAQREGQSSEGIS
jgi:O-antigen/teichoic acid export membrane protein